MKVKILTRSNLSDLESDINNFLNENKNMEIKDIKYQISSNESYSYGSAMIIYEEIEEIKNGK